MRSVARTFKALSDPTRLRIVLLLRRRELCVCEIMFILGQEQSRVSHQMRILREAGLAEDIRQGRWMVYRIPSTARSWLEGLFGGPLRAAVADDEVLAADVSRLEACLRQNVRQACQPPPARDPRKARPARKAPAARRERKEGPARARERGRS